MRPYFLKEEIWKMWQINQNNGDCNEKKFNVKSVNTTAVFQF